MVKCHIFYESSTSSILSFSHLVIILFKAKYSDIATLKIFKIQCCSYLFWLFYDLKIWSIC